MAKVAVKFAAMFAAAALTRLASAADPAEPFYTTQTLVFRVEPNTTITRELITTTGTEYLKAVIPGLSEPNASIVKLAMEYPTDGIHTYWWPKRGEPQYDGSTTDVVVGGHVVMKGEPEGRTFCCGLTLEVFYKYLAQNPKLLERTTDSRQLKSLWFCRDINAPGPLEAMIETNTGRKIENPEDALPGDFVQIWRDNKSGHSVIFVNWLRGAKGERIGLQYWSTQIKTKGIGLNSELFGSVPGLGMVSEEHLSVARPLIIR